MADLSKRSIIRRLEGAGIPAPDVIVVCVACGQLCDIVNEDRGVVSCAEHGVLARVKPAKIAEARECGKVIRVKQRVAQSHGWRRGSIGTQ